MTVTQTPMNIHHKLEAREKKALAKIIAAGHESPYKDFPDALIVNDDRRYVEDLINVKYSDIDENQVSVVVVEVERAKGVKALIEKDGICHNPPLIERTGKGKYTYITGHHRAWALDGIHNGGAFPVILTTGLYNLNGNPVSPDAALRGGIRANPQSTHKQYSMEDVARNINKSLKLNPTQDGLLSPPGVLPPRYKKDAPSCTFDFDDLVDRVHCKDTYSWPASRTKIYGMAAKPKSKVLLQTKGTQYVHRQKMGWGHPPTPKSIPKGSGISNSFYYDTHRRSIILATSSFSGRFDRQMLDHIVMPWHHEPNFEKNLKKNNIINIDILSEIHKPDGDKTTLDASRDAFVKNVRKWIAVLKTLGIPLTLRQVAFPKQLKGADTPVTETV